METIRLGQLPHEDIAAVGIWAAELYWHRGHVTEYTGAGRLNNLLFWMQSGRRRYSVDGEVFEVGPGALLLMPAGSRYRTEVTDDGCRGVVLDFSLLDRTGQPVRLGDRVTRLEEEADPRVSGLLEALAASYRENGGPLRGKELIFRLFARLCEVSRLPEDRELQPALRWMEQHPDRALRLPEAASLCHMSVSSFTRRFRTALGASPAAYHRRLRLLRGRELLESGLYTVEQAAAMLGFCDPPHFCRAYTALFGTKPSQACGGGYAPAGNARPVISE